MIRVLGGGLAGLCLALGVVSWAAPPEPAPSPRLAATRVAAVIETTLATAGENIRQFAFDGDPATVFVSANNPGPADHLTLVFERPVAVTGVVARTGRVSGGDALETGVLEVSVDGIAFACLCRFVEGAASGDAGGKLLKAVRLRPTAPMTHPLAVREIEIHSTPRVAVFRHPVEFVLDVTDAPEMTEWGEKAVKVCERQYEMICDELTSDGFRPPTLLRMTLKNDYKGVAAAGGGRIVGSAKYFKSHPDDIGAMVHETVHCVQNYRGQGNPGWLVEGIADYVRFFRYEPRLPGPLAPEKARFDGSYRITAVFLAFVNETYDRQAVKKLNAAMRQGRYRPEIWKDMTGKTVEDLGREWQKSLAR